MPASFAPGLPCFEATVRFQCGDLLFTLLDALVYMGDEFAVEGRTIKLEKGQKLWVVTFRAEEDVTRIERHSNTPLVVETETPNVKLRDAALLRRPA
jgi:hypothetical protein